MKIFIADEGAYNLSFSKIEEEFTEDYQIIVDGQIFGDESESLLFGTSVKLDALATRSHYLVQ